MVLCWVWVYVPVHLLVLFGLLCGDDLVDHVGGVVLRLERYVMRSMPVLWLFDALIEGDSVMYATLRYFLQMARGSSICRRYCMYYCGGAMVGFCEGATTD